MGGMVTVIRKGSGVSHGRTGMSGLTPTSALRGCLRGHRNARRRVLASQRYTVKRSGLNGRMRISTMISYPLCHAYARRTYYI